MTWCLLKIKELKSRDFGKLGQCEQDAAQCESDGAHRVSNSNLDLTWVEGRKYPEICARSTRICVNEVVWQTQGIAFFIDLVYGLPFFGA